MTKRAKTGGRKRMYNEPTGTFTTRAPLSHIPRLKELIQQFLNELKK